MNDCQGIYEKMSLPQTARTEGKIAKKDIYENAALSSSERKIFLDVEKIYWRYAFKQQNTFIPPFTNEEEDYPEIEIIEVYLRGTKQAKKIAECILRTLPYPLLLFLQEPEAGKVQLWLGCIRINQTDREKMTLTEMQTTPWLTTDDAFWSRLALPKMKTQDFRALYQSWFDVVSQKRLEDAAAAPVALAGKAAREVLSKLQKIEQEISSLRARLKREKQLNRKVELHVALKKMERKKKHLLEMCEGSRE